ncbi:hypothetical protein BJV82DRAFT_241409 [Fennellomyces sp. T-0311]|nr:hypothetical protein BJV82DRAFT_241409 [Fennellomyces sp. T-0311]
MVVIPWRYVSFQVIAMFAIFAIVMLAAFVAVFVVHIIIIIIVLIAKYLAFPLLYPHYRRLISLFANLFKVPSCPAQCPCDYGKELDVSTFRLPPRPPARLRTRPQTWCYDIIEELQALEDASASSVPPCHAQPNVIIEELQALEDRLQAQCYGILAELDASASSVPPCYAQPEDIMEELKALEDRFQTRCHDIIAELDGLESVSM